MSDGIAIYYDSDEVDLKGMIQQLAERQGSRFGGRSVSAIARMLLTEALEGEIGKESSEEDEDRR